MGQKSSVVAALAFLVAPSIVQAQVADGPVHYSPGEYLKNFALSVCISNGYGSDEVTMDSRAAAGGYLELGGFPIEAYEETDALSKIFLAKEYHGIHGGKLTLMKCIDLLHSKELEQIVEKYDKK